MDANNHRFSDRVPYAARVMVIRGQQAWVGEVVDLSEGGCGLFRPEDCALEVAEIVQLVFSTRLDRPCWWMRAWPAWKPARSVSSTTSRSPCRPCAPESTSPARPIPHAARMPEGPEIRRAADRLSAAVAGQPLATAWFHFPELKRHQRTLVGRRILAIEPHGKALLTHFDHGLTLYSHNQLYGVWKIAPAGQRPDSARSLRVALETGTTAVLLYSASEVEMWKTDELAKHPFLSKLGPDVLDPRLKAAEVAKRLQDPRL
ncbi:DNA-formamidopyrimidine glycosylase family protein [Arenimonas daejeonensis]|uniref:DNA-formamidopyrimidine glycosylase family protein n=1 Tax=Arenimonas daejeonensis TaxID=370777 RepID=UPI001D147260|nr:DNA-formamidopyrimidine glycosylase family protein [Arenimonas daejeonensis]